MHRNDDMDDEEEEDEQFMLQEIDFEIDRTFSKVVASQNSLIFTTEQGEVVHFDQSTEQARFLTLEKSSAPNHVVHGTFIDPSGCHLLISMENGENYYFNTVNMKKPKKLRQLVRGIFVVDVFSVQLW